MRVLFLSKKENTFAERASEYLKLHFTDPMIYFGTRHEKLPGEILTWKGDLLISFISQWIIPQELLQNARMAINFHPGSPEYPGIGCTNFAIYNGEKEYGVTCHHMSSKVDTGQIIAVKRFPISEDDSVYSVTQRSYENLEAMFYEIMNGLLENRGLPESGEKWKRLPYTRKQLNDLCYIAPDMSAEEVEKRIRATTYETPWAYTKIGKHVFKLKDKS